MSELRERVSRQHTGGQMTSPGGTTTPIPGATSGPIVPVQSEVPDLADSPYVADPKASVVAAWSRVMADVQWIGKGTSRGLNYEFRGIDAVLNAVGPALRKHGVVVIPVKVEPEFTMITTKGGSVMNYCRATVSYAIFGPMGDRFPVDGVALGEAFDSADKSATKAQSVALRVFYIDALAIPTNQPQLDPEYGPQHEIAAPAAPDAEEYARIIQDDKTTLAKLLQIRKHLAAHRDIAETAVTTLAGEEIQLSDLLTREGRKRQGGQQ